MNRNSPVLSIEVTQIAKIKVSYYHLKLISARTFPQKWLKWNIYIKKKGFCATLENVSQATLIKPRKRRNLTALIPSLQRKPPWP